MIPEQGERNESAAAMLLHIESQPGAKTQPLVVWRERLTFFISVALGGTASQKLRFAAMPTQPKRLSPPALCALLAAIGGLLGGSAAVQGLHQREYGPLHPPSLFGAGSEGVSAADDGDRGGYDEHGTEACDQCSERDLGYRWATLAQARSPADCPNDSWGFRRGCLDYTGGL